MKNFSLKQSFFCARAEFIKWICDARMMILGVLLIFIYSFAIEPLKSNAKLMGEPLNILEPFIAIANSGAILLIIPLVFLTLIADFPKIDTNTVFYIMRVGRLNWLFGQLLKLVFMAVSYLAVIFLGAVLPMLSDGFWYNGWSNVATKFASRFPEHSGNFGVQLLPENLYNQLTVFSAAVQSYLLVFAYLMIIGLILLSFSLVKHKTVGFVLCGAVISLGTAFCSIKTTLMWAMPMANSIIWLHYTKYFREPIMPMSFSISYLAIFISVLLAFCFIAIRKFNYDNVAEIANDVCLTLADRPICLQPYSKSSYITTCFLKKFIFINTEVEIATKNHQISSNILQNSVGANIVRPSKQQTKSTILTKSIVLL